MEAGKKYFIYSLLLHGLVLVITIMEIQFATLPPVIENSTKRDIINVVILGDTPKSKVLPVQPPIEKPIPKIEPPKPQVPPKIVKPSNPTPPKTTEKKIVLEKVKPIKKKIIKRDDIAKDLLKDMEKIVENKKKEKSKLQAEKRHREQLEKTLRQQLLAEQTKLKAAEEKRTQGIVDKYKALILQAISEHWLIPLQSNKKLACVLYIRLSATGQVLDVQVTKSSGDLALDSSARNAVMKASPLPVPTEKNAFVTFKNFELKMKPETMLSYNTSR